MRHRLTPREFAVELAITVIVEHHGGSFSDPQSAVGVGERSDHLRCGTRPDFGNFEIEDGEAYDASYQGVEELMPSAKDVPARRRGYEFKGNRFEIDVPQGVRMVLDAHHRAYVGNEKRGDDRIQRAQDRFAAAGKKLTPIYR